MNTSETRKRGALLGLAWGDVYGCPVEGWRARQIRQVYGDYETLPQAYDHQAIEAAGARLDRLRPLGLHSDDTQQALALLTICLEGWSLERWSRCLVQGLDAKAWRGYGRNFAQAVYALRKGIPPEMAGSQSAGIGAAMRSGPLGALYSRQSARLAEVAWESSLVTHGDLRAGALAHAVAWCVGRFVQGATAAQVASALPGVLAEAETDWLERHPEWTIERRGGHQVSAALAIALPQRDQPSAQLRGAISELARPHLAAGLTRAHPNQGFVLLGGVHAIAMALRSDDEPQAILAEIVRQGFDTDTVAAMAGSVLGARYGTDWIPTECFHDLPSLERYAQALTAAEPAERLAFLLKREAALTNEEASFQAELRP